VPAESPLLPLLADPDDPEHLGQALLAMAEPGGVTALSAALMAAQRNRPAVALDIVGRVFARSTPQGTGFAAHSMLRALERTPLVEEPRFQTLLDHMRIEPGP